jgi:hypothetical protein
MVSAGMKPAFQANDTPTIAVCGLEECLQIVLCGFCVVEK